MITQTEIETYAEQMAELIGDIDLDFDDLQTILHRAEEIKRERAEQRLAWAAEVKEAKARLAARDAEAKQDADNWKLETAKPAWLRRRR